MSSSDVSARIASKPFAGRAWDKGNITSKMRNNVIKGPDGKILWHSKQERDRYDELRLLEKAGQIRDVQRQKTFVLIESFRDEWGEAHRPTKIIVDFTYELRTGDENVKWIKIAEDVKGSKSTETPDFRIKKKLFILRYPEYKFICQYKRTSGR